MRKVFIVGFIVMCVAVLSNCVSDGAVEDMRGAAYAGSEACKSCHKDIYNSFAQTAHFNTSSDSLPVVVMEDFKEGKNVFTFNDSTKVVMERKGDKYYQTYVRGGREIVSHPFDIVVGSGRKAQTYLYYNDQKKISQLPISYFMAEHAWANSPGFPAHEAKFDRNVPSYCMGCHSSYIAVEQTFQGALLQETFEKGKIAYGIDCERCHGPAKAHVEQSKPMTSIRTLNRVQKNDLCALCHSGFKDVQQSLFSFKPGDDLNNFYIPDFGRVDTAMLDVHGNQTQLMMASKCFQMSNDLTCNTCHNVHVKERDNLTVFDQRCKNCHQQVQHSFADNTVQNNCVQCHMPLKPSSAIAMLTNQKKSAVPDLIRTHLIAVYYKSPQLKASPAKPASD